MTDQLSNPFISPLFHMETPEGDDKLRRVCAHCRFIDYVNPKIVAGSVVTKNGQILLCRRAIEPRKGYWTLPAGFMEEGETVEEGARREAQEEACADICIEPHAGRILRSAYIAGPDHVPGRARFRIFLPGPESLEVGLFEWKDIPWSESCLSDRGVGADPFCPDARTGPAFAALQPIPPGTERP